MIEKIIIVILGGVVGFSLTLFKEMFTSRKKKTMDRYYLSILVSSALEQFVNGCTQVVSDVGHQDRHGYLQANVTVPNFEPMALDVEWKVLDSELMYEILSLPELINEANAYISSVREHVATPPDFDEFFETRSTKYAILGLIAIKISDELRQLGSLPKRKQEDRGASHRFLYIIKTNEDLVQMRADSQRKMFEQFSQKQNA